MYPDYTSSFDIVISSSATSTGAVPTCKDETTFCHDTLVGKTDLKCPGAKDKASPWPPYNEGGKYLFTNPDGDDPDSPNGQRTFSPYWQTFIESSPMDPIKYQVTPTISSLNPKDKNGAFMRPMEIAGGNDTFPEGIEDVPFIYAGETKINGKGGEPVSLSIPGNYKPMSVGGAGKQKQKRRRWARHSGTER